MAKWADYLISGIWKSKPNNTHITHVLLHEDTEEMFKPGVKTTRAHVVKLIKNGKKVKTIQWNYHSSAWKPGESVGWLEIDGVEYIRTHKDRTVNDNLDHLIRMDNLLD